MNFLPMRQRRNGLAAESANLQSKCITKISSSPLLKFRYFFRRCSKAETAKEVRLANGNPNSSHAKTQQPTHRIERRRMRARAQLNRKVKLNLQKNEMWKKSTSSPVIWTNELESWRARARLHLLTLPRFHFFLPWPFLIREIRDLYSWKGDSTLDPTTLLHLGT